MLWPGQRRLNARRILAGALVVLGAVLLFAAPETPAGGIIVALGIALELAGIALERRARRRE
jgi:hypothetical protein